VGSPSGRHLDHRPVAEISQRRLLVICAKKVKRSLPIFFSH
jgi:hypothetical protein